MQVEIIGDASSLERAFGQAGKSTSGFSRGIATASKVAVGAFAALGLGAKIGFDELAEGQKVSAQTEAVLKSTGGAAKITQGQIEGLAGALSKKTGVDDEAIQSGQNMLLTFTRIRNEVGAGNAVFDQATKATLNLSVAMGKDMQSSALLVGKALNDPIKGLSALSRAGIQFTEEQKAMVKGMVESGNVMGAQKVILKELETQFGGSANAAGKTLTGSINKAKNAFSEMAAQLVSALLPTLTRFAAFVQTASKFLTEHQQAVQIGAVALAGLATAVLAVNAAMKVYAAGAAVARAAQIAFNLAMAMNPIGLVIIALVALGVGLVVAYKKSETFREIVNAAFTAVKNTVATVIQGILGYVNLWLGGLEMMMRAASKLPFVGDKFKGVANAVSDARDKVQGLSDAIGNLKSKEITITTNLVTYGNTAAAPSLGVIGRRAHGGPVRGGSPYLVGERGPELMVPGRSGAVIPNGGARSMGGGTVINVTLPNYMGERQEIVELLRTELIRVGRRNGGSALGGYA